MFPHSSPHSLGCIIRKLLKSHLSHAGDYFHLAGAVQEGQERGSVLMAIDYRRMGCVGKL